MCNLFKTMCQTTYTLNLIKRQLFTIRIVTAYRQKMSKLQIISRGVGKMSQAAREQLIPSNTYGKDQ